MNGAANWQRRSFSQEVIRELAIFTAVRMEASGKEKNDSQVLKNAWRQQDARLKKNFLEIVIMEMPTGLRSKLLNLALMPYFVRLT